MRRIRESCTVFPRPVKERSHIVEGYRCAGWETAPLGAMIRQEFLKYDQEAVVARRDRKLNLFGRSIQILAEARRGMVECCQHTDPCGHGNVLRCPLPDQAANQSG